MILRDLINELRDLGFEEDATMQEYNEVTINAINRATWLIYDTVVVPLIGYYKRTLAEITEHIHIESIYEDENEELVKEITDYDVTRIGDGAPKEVEGTKVIVIKPASVTDEIGTTKKITKISEEEWYPERPEVLSIASPVSTEIGLPDNTLRITALLTAHYLWLDDDEVKAVYYYNEYESFARALIDACTSNAKVRVITNGWGW